MIYNFSYMFNNFLNYQNIQLYNHKYYLLYQNYQDNLDMQLLHYKFYIQPYKIDMIQYHNSHPNKYINYFLMIFLNYLGKIDMCQLNCKFYMFVSIMNKKVNHYQRNHQCKYRILQFYDQSPGKISTYSHSHKQHIYNHIFHMPFNLLHNIRRDNCKQVHLLYKNCWHMLNNLRECSNKIHIIKSKPMDLIQPFINNNRNQLI